MLHSRTVNAARAVGGRATPNALVGAGTVAVLLHRRVAATRTVARAVTMSAFGAHVGSFDADIIAYFSARVFDVTIYNPITAAHHVLVSSGPCCRSRQM